MRVTTYVLSEHRIHDRADGCEANCSHAWGGGNTGGKRVKYQPVYLIMSVNFMIFASSGMMSHHTAEFELNVTASNSTVESEIYMAPPWKQKSMWWLLVC